MTHLARITHNALFLARIVSWRAGVRHFIYCLGSPLS